MKLPQEESTALLDAMLKCDERGFRSHDIKNISMNGVFVLARDGTLSRLRKNTPVELALKMRANGKTKIHLFKAEVTAVDHNGAALVFRDADVDAYSALLHLALYKSR